MTTLDVVGIEQYCHAVRAALADLSAAQVAELTEDLPDHLAEVLADGEGSLVDRLGAPDAYAAELRVAAGLPPRDPRVRPARDELVLRFIAWARRADVRLGRVFGASRLVDVLSLLQPAWWVVRGWIVAQLVCNRGTWHGVVPHLGSYGAGGGLLVTLALVVLSVIVGLRVRRATTWVRVGVAAVSAIVALWGLTVLVQQSSSAAAGGGYGVVESGPSYNDLYVYDSNGNLVPDARIYDQDGNPVDLGDGYCQSGLPASGLQPTTPDGAYTYPLCPGDPGPFQSGPGAVASPDNGSPSAQPSAGSTAPGPTSGAPSSGSAPTSATASGSPTR